WPVGRCGAPAGAERCQLRYLRLWRGCPYCMASAAECDRAADPHDCLCELYGRNVDAAKLPGADLVEQHGQLCCPARGPDSGIIPDQPAVDGEEHSAG